MKGEIELVHSEPVVAERLDPFPEGWFVVANSRDLARGELKERIWLGRSIVYWRDQNGDVCVADGICPHLGSHLGPSVGGKLKDGNLVCPFHGFEYGINGECIRIRGAKPPRSARLRRFAVTETCGLIFAYFGDDPDNPRWKMPVFSDEYEARGQRRLQFRAHPQTTSENSVDFNHLEQVHDYMDLTKLQDAEVTGPFLFTRYSFTRRMLTFGVRRFKATVQISIKVWGLGVSTVDITSNNGILARQFVLSTPIDGETVDMWLLMDIQQLPNLWWLKGLLRKALAVLGAQIGVNDLKLDVTKDAVIWEKQNFRAKPAFSAHDRDISLYRRYCEQFYSQGRP